MNQSYDDIRDKLGEPRWWDECGVPRYCEMAPSKVNDIYADEVAFVEIACQRCRVPFLVAMTCNVLSKWRLSVLLQRDGCLNYGDPPNVGCCPAGPTMISDSIRVVQFWKRDKRRDWVRMPELEREKEQ